MNEFITNHQGGLTQVTDFFKKDISSIRTGRANPSILDSVVVDSYGSKVPLQQVANISVVDASCMLVKPWDKGALKDIEKAIIDADIGISPVNEGEQLRLTIPQPTEEDRKNLVKKLNEKLEQAKIKNRGVRESIKKDIEAAFGNKEISEDDKTRDLKEMEDEIKKQNDSLQVVRDAKEKEIMTI